MTDRETEIPARSSGLGLWFVQILVAIGASVFVFVFLPMGVGACAPNCNVTLMLTTIYTFMGTAIALVVLTGIALLFIRLRRRESRRSAWWIPLLGIVLTLIGTGVANHLANVALSPNGGV